MPGRRPYRSISSAWNAVNLVEHQEDDLHESASRLKTPPYCRYASATMSFSRAVRRPVADAYLSIQAAISLPPTSKPLFGM
jgi:hypothetical protein